MSVNKYDSTTGTLTTLASGDRTWIGTRAQYEAQKTAGTLPNNCLIIITDDEQDSRADQISYDNTESGLSADNVQDAIDVLSNIGEIINGTTVTNDVTTGGYVEVCRITLPKGVWVLRGFAQYPNNPTGIRAFGLSANLDVGSTAPLSAQSGWNMCLPDTMIIQTSGDTVVHGVCYQTSGSTLTLLNSLIKAVRIK